MTFDTEQSQKPLMIMECVKASYAVLWDNRILFLKAVFPFAFILGLSAFFVPMPIFPHGAENALPPNTHAYPQFGMAGFISGLAAWLFVSSFHVSWQRFLVFGNKPTALYFKAPYWSYLGATLLLMLGFAGWTLLSYLPLVIMAVAARKFGLIFLPVMLVGIAMSFIWFLRRCMIYPARALGNKNLTWKQSSQAMRGHVWAYFAAGFLAYLPFMIPSILEMIVMFTVKEPLPAPLYYAMQVIQQFCGFGCAAIGGSVLVYFYRALIDKTPVI